MYSPRIQEDLLAMLQDIQQARNKPLTTLVDELLRPQVLTLHEQLTHTSGYAVQPQLLTVSDQPLQKVRITGPQDVWELCRDMQTLKQERLDVLILNTKHLVEHRQAVFLGTLNSSVVHPREIYALAIEQRAASIIVVHNHPSGCSKPSNEDLRATQTIKEVGKLIDIPLLDHIIIGESYCSLKEQCYL